MLCRASNHAAGHQVKICAEFFRPRASAAGCRPRPAMMPTFTSGCPKRAVLACNDNVAMHCRKLAAAAEGKAADRCDQWFLEMRRSPSPPSACSRRAFPRRRPWTFRKYRRRRRAFSVPASTYPHLVVFGQRRELFGDLASDRDIERIQGLRTAVTKNGDTRSGRSMLRSDIATTHSSDQTRGPGRHRPRYSAR